MIRRSQGLRCLLGMLSLDPLAAARAVADLHVELRDDRLHWRNVGLLLNVDRLASQPHAAVGADIHRDRDGAVHSVGLRPCIPRMPRLAARLALFIRLLLLGSTKRRCLPLAGASLLFELLLQLVQPRLECRELLLLCGELTFQLPAAGALCRWRESVHPAINMTPRYNSEKISLRR